MAIPPERGNDPVLARRAQIGRLVALGQRIGYGLWLVAIAVFVSGAVTRFRSAMVTVVIGCLAVGSALLAPSIVISYGVRAADREERQGGGGHREGEHGGGGHREGKHGGGGHREGGHH